MATVRFSDELKTEIISNAKALFSKRLQAYHDNPPAVGDEVADRIFKDFMPVVAQLPKQFLSWTDELSIDAINGRTYGKRFKLSKQVPKPNSDLTTANARMYDRYRLDVKLIGDEWSDIQAQLDAWISNIAAVEQERDAFVEGVKKIIGMHTTLGPALKAWPPLGLGTRGYEEPPSQGGGTCQAGGGRGRCRSDSTDGYYNCSQVCEVR